MIPFFFTFIGVLLGVLVFLVVTAQIIAFWVTGWFISEKDLDVYFENHPLGKYEVHKDILLLYPVYPELWPAIFMQPFAGNLPLSKWYFSDDYGCIPRWSKWTKRISEHKKSNDTKCKSLVDIGV